MNSFDIKRYQRYGFGERTQTPALFFGLLATREGRDSRTPSPNLKATGSMSQLIDLSLTCTPSSMASPVKRFASKKKQKAPSLTIFNSFSMIFHPLSPQKSHHTFSSSSVFSYETLLFLAQPLGFTGAPLPWRHARPAAARPGHALVHAAPAPRRRFDAAERRLQWRAARAEGGGIGRGRTGRWRKPGVWSS